ncbi:MAG TPA: ABC transporter ATP-binding protein [Candidatus Sulfotelmatobacter sp.]|nr:ABC transporter ATP-binding protein [Candidatus Sulfotelmatobacter sp.]
MNPVLQIRGLTVRLPAGADRRNAVDGIDLEVGPREIVCVVGESGSGKSVTAFSIMGLLPKGQLVPTAGEIRLQGEDVLRASPQRLRELRGSRMSMIFQEPMTALNPVIPVGDQIAEVLETHGTRDGGALDAAGRERRIAELFDDVRLPEPERLRRAYPHQLSGGQRQRIMIAMALALEPALIIADEPTTALDVTTQAQILRLIKAIQAEHQSGVLFITHDFGVVAEIADRVAVMKDGAIVETGATRDVLARPQHPYTRMLIAAVPGVAAKARAPIGAAPVVLATRGLTKIYRTSGWLQARRDVHAADAVDLTIRRGETLGIVGESGSGKSTVARCVARLIEPTGGEISLDGQPIATLSATRLRRHRRHIQIIFQDPYRSLNPRRTVGKSIVEGPMNFGLSKADAWSRAHALLDLVGIDPAAIDRYPHQFSGGQRQRICIARALAMEPTLLIADEAVSALDVSVQAQVLALLDDVKQRFELAMLFITHDLRVAAQVCDSVAVMLKGRVVEYGSAAEIFANPRHDYTRALFDAAPGKGWQFGTAAE